MALALLASSLILMASASKVTLRGRIIAYRPGDRIAQVASLVPNEEVFLFEIDPAKAGKKAKVARIAYRHFGQTEITEQMLQSAPLLDLKVQRSRSCDQSYKDFVATAPRILEDGSTKEVISGIRLVGHQDGELPADTKLTCYVLQEGALRIVN